MGKHIKWQIKYNHVMRYRDGESPTMLGHEIQSLGLSNIKKGKYIDTILRWNNQYKENGIKDLISKTGSNSSGRPPKQKPSESTKDEFKDWTKEELQRLIEIYREINHDISKKESYSYIKKEKILSIIKMCKALGVSKSGYYKWLNNGAKTTGTYDEKLLKEIKFLFYLKKEIFGFRRIKVLLEKE